jgi:hypothetical protein
VCGGKGKEPDPRPRGPRGPGLGFLVSMSVRGTSFLPFAYVIAANVFFLLFVIVILIVVVVIDRSRVHVHMPMSYRASKGTTIAPQHTGNNGCKSWGLVDRWCGV